MLWWRYWRWELSRSFCVKIIRLGNQIKRLSLEIRSLFKRSMNLVVGKGILDRIVVLIEDMDEVIFSAGALLFREEKKLISFLEKVSREVEKLKSELRKKKGKYAKEVKELERISRELKVKKSKLSKSRKRKLEKKNIVVLEDEKIKDSLTALLNKLKNFLIGMEAKLHNLHLEAKAQRRKTLNVYRIRENFPMRSGYRLGELVGRRGIEVGSLLKSIQSKVKHFKRIVRKRKEINKSQVEELIKHCSLEADDLRNIFMWILQESEKVEEQLRRLGRIILSEPGLRPLTGRYNRANSRLNLLRSDIQTQYRRLDNEFKKKRIVKAAA